jgi:hypothetical protein
MKHQTLLQLFSLTLALAFLIGCGNSSMLVEPAMTFTPEQPTVTSTPVPPTATLTPVPPTPVAPTATLTPVPPTPALDQVGDRVFKTPEEAIDYYFEGLLQADVRKIMDACAINEMGEKFRFDLYAEWVGYLTMTALAPTDYPLYVELNKIQLSEDILSGVKFFAYSLLTSEEVYKGRTIPIDTERASQFVIDANPERLAEIKIQRIELPDKAQMNSARYIESAARRASVYGADDSTERVVLFEFEGNYYYVGFTLLRYGENWKINWQVSQLANTSSLGAAQETTIDEFEAMVNGD